MQRCDVFCEVRQKTGPHTQETTSLKATPVVKINMLHNIEESEWHTSWSEHKDCNEELSTDFPTA